MPLDGAKITYAAEDEAIVAVSESGFVTPKAIGGTKVTVTVQIGDNTATQYLYFSVTLGKTESTIYTPEMVLGPKRKGIKLTYCTDTRPTEGIVKNAAGADLFICEGMYGEKEKAAKAVEYKHMTFYEAAELAKEANVGEMWLTHYSPSLTKPEHYMNDVKKIFPRAKAGKDGMSVDLMFED